MPELIQNPQTNEKPKKLTPKRKAFVQRRLDAPTESLASSAIAAGYNTDNRISASNIGSDLMRKPEIIMALGEHSDLFESVIVGTARDWKDAKKPRQREIALTAAMYGHDKIHGKATTRIEQQTNIVKVVINLTGDGDDTPPAELLASA